MGFYADEVLPRCINVLLANAEFRKVRRRVAAGLWGEVLEVGFGSGLNVPFYPPEVKRVRAVDPAEVGRKLAAKRVRASTVPVEYVGLEAEHLPLETESVDHVLVTWTMCTIPNPGRALQEMHRVLRPGGQLHFVEHGKAPDAKVARWQDRLNPLQQKLAGGCNLNRSIDQIVAGAGFVIENLDNYYAKGPKFLGYLYEGTAAKPQAAPAESGRG